MSGRTESQLRKLERIARRYDGMGETKQTLLRRLARGAFARPKDLLLYHEILCFLSAYPDDPRVLAEVEACLEAFSARGDLRRLRSRLADTGLAGTDTRYSFYWATACWLAERWPERITIDWEDFEGEAQFERILPLLVPFCETPALDSLAFSAREWLERLKGGETDAAFLVRRVAAMPGDDFTRESFYHELNLTLKLSPGPGTPSRTHARLPGSRIYHQTRSLRRERPSLREEIQRPPLAVREVSPRRAERIIDLARESMVTRSRDLDAFMYADPADVRLVDCGEGLSFACLGMRPERRLMLEAVYGFLTLKNGVPIGYLLISSLFGCSEIAFNVFDSFRGAEAGAIFGRVMGTARWLFGSDAFTIDPYQLGHGNAEGRESGAWWFYYKFGFRPEDPSVRRLVRAELRRMEGDPAYRSSPEKLEALSAAPMFFYGDGRRPDTLPGISLGNIGLAISGLLADRFGAEREDGLAACAKECARLLGLRSLRSLTTGERLAWERWSPLALSLAGLSRWPESDKKLLRQIMLAKGGRRESDYVALFNRHARLRRALLKLAGMP